MEISDLQKKVNKFVENRDIKTGVETRLLDLISEIGEISKEVLKGNHYGEKEFKKTDEWNEELGDVFFSLICIANSTEINLEESLKTVIEKYEKRIEKKGKISSGK